MGAELFPVFNPPVRAASFDGDGKLLLREYAALDSIAKKLNLTPFTAFGDTRKIPEDYSNDPHELGEVLGDGDDWFSIDDGLRTIDGLVDTIKNQPDIAVWLERPDLILSDLEDLSNCLRVAREKNARFRLEVT